MRLTIRILGLEILQLEATTDDDNGTDPGDCTTTPIGFTPTPGDQRWEPGTDHQ